MCVCYGRGHIPMDKHITTHDENNKGLTKLLVRNWNMLHYMHLTKKKKHYLFYLTIVLEYL